MIVLDEATRLKNIDSAIRRGLPDLQAYKRHSGVWHICAGGPSLRKEIKKIKRLGKMVVSVNGTHDYLLSKGVQPDIFVLTDPQAHCTRFVKNPQRQVVYLIAAHCDPAVFDALVGYTVLVWYPLDYELPVPVSIGGGTTVGLRAINIGYTLGYRDIHLYGFDGCVRQSHHAYPQPQNDGDEIRDVKWRGKTFRMTDWMCAQAENFEELLTMAHGMKITVHSPGVIKHIGKDHG